MTHTKGRAIRARAKRSQRATHTHTPPTPAAFIAAVPDTAGTPLVVRSFASPITILDGAAITIQRVRQHVLSDAFDGEERAVKRRSAW